MKSLFAHSSETLLNAERGRSELIDSKPALSFNVSVNADRRRVFHLLTIPEYMETWLSVPGRHKQSPINVTTDPAGFQVQYFDEHGTQASLVAAYQTCRTAKTQFFWRRKSTAASDVSFVKIRLIGDFERTTLCLTHSGLASETDRRWHSQFWDQSLKRLSSLFELQ
jgi:uncharacterized protein YndB with AHSA1/START domain